MWIVQKQIVSSGVASLDRVVQGIRLGDNVVWQIDKLQDYIHFARAFADTALAEQAPCVYVRFAPHEAILSPRPGLEILDVDPSLGFDAFNREIHRIITQQGQGVRYVFDSLSSLVAEWATDELLANFFQFACPYLFELDTVAYFAVSRGQHANSTLARIRDTTQVLFDVFHADGEMYIHPLKVWDRYTKQMFLPHLVVGDELQPVFSSGAAAAVSGRARPQPLKSQGSSAAPWSSVHEKLIQYRAVERDSGRSLPEMLPLKNELARMLLGQQPQTLALAERYLDADDLLSVRDRVVGSGRVGGKAAGMILARGILRSAKADFPHAEVLEDHDSFYIGSDVFFSFLVRNGLSRLRWQFTKASALSQEAFADIEQQFLQGSFPEDILEQFKDMLDYYGEAPIIVRSSSLMEDGFGNAFAGKYRSEFCANQGSPAQRLGKFVEAVKLVYASCLNPNALAYRQKRGLMENDEQMAILVQRVSGTPYRHYFFPSLAGVAFSRNLYAWTDKIDPRQGLVRLVFGLGTRAVDQTGNDYPRMFSVSQPQLRPEVGRQIRKYSQRQLDLIDLDANQMTTLPVNEVLETGDYPRLDLYASVYHDGYMRDSLFRRQGKPLVLTFNNLLGRTTFAELLGGMLRTIEDAYDGPVDVEFTAAVTKSGQVRINLLQCRPLVLPGAARSAAQKEPLSADAVLFRTEHTMPSDHGERIRYILYIDPWQYPQLSEKRKRSLVQLVAAVNGHPALAGEHIMMMGPGRWGSSQINLGIGVSYAAINQASVLVEVALGRAEQIPELSYGTHFFQDLVEDGIAYMPVYPDSAEAQFNKAFFTNGENALTQWLPQAQAYEDVVRIIDVPAAAGGAYVHIRIDPDTLQGLCFLDPPAARDWF